jgi:hypothetical protein
VSSTSIIGSLTVVVDCAMGLGVLNSLLRIDAFLLGTTSLAKNKLEFEVVAYNYPYNIMYENVATPIVLVVQSVSSCPHHRAE